MIAGSRGDPFTFDIAIDVALKEINNCYIKQGFSPSTDLRIPYMLHGKYFDSLVEVLFILLQNALRHSGFSDAPQGVEVRVWDDDQTLFVEVTNDLAPGVDIEGRREVASNVMSRYELAPALKMARTEGGSGLSKVWRILEFDFKVTHGLSLEVLEPRRFRARVSFDSSNIRT
jgi:LytS/YehU family sensor histidine kinase